ncbi:MAG: glycosyltransferase [Sphingobacteriaceae bacterium]|nr:MAG: glycosyltransferase [Sphingobacteriaceae bacterium]
MIIAIYVTLFFIILRFVVTLFNFLSNPKLPHIAHPHYAKVSILIPARNEAENIIALLESIAKHDNQKYEVLILDDHSTDNTYELCQTFAATHSNFRVIKGAELPAGWLGKNYACHQLAQQATGDYFLFLDADEVIYPGLLNSAIHRMQLRNLALLSLFTNQQMLSFGEKAVVPLMHYILLNLLPLRLVYLLKNPMIAAASGQFMLFDAALYRRYEWHQLVKEKVVEDVEIMKCIKAKKYNGETLLANGMISCRMYKSYGETINGFGKNFLAAFNYSIPGFLVYLTLLIAGPLIVIMTMNMPLIFFMAGLIILSRIMVSFLSGQSALMNIILHPIQMFNLVVIAFTSIQKHLTKTTVWKGRRV